MTWTAEKAIPTIAVPDLDLAINFYERLGCLVDWKWPTESPTHVGLMLGPTAIMLALCDPAVQADVYFIVDDVAACYADALDKKCWELATAAAGEWPDCPPKRSLDAPPCPKEQQYGLKDFSVIDPWGNSLSFGEVIREPNEES